MSTHLPPQQNRTEINPPGSGVHGISRNETSLPPGPLLVNESQNHSTPLLEIIPKNSKVDLPQMAQLEAYTVKNVKYQPVYGPMMYKWFSEKKKFDEITETFMWKSGEVEEKKKRRALPPPHFSEFARTIGTTAAGLKRWAKNHEEFREYHDACMDIIQEFMIDNGVTGEYASQMTIFAAKNTTKMKDVQENRNMNVNMKDVLDAIEKGTIDKEEF